MTDKVLIRSYAGGVTTPEMFGRIDQVKNQTGLSEAINFRTLPHGPAESRAGFEYVNEVKDSNAVTCLIPFVYSTTQSMVLEFGNLYVRFHTLGGTLLETVKNITAITQANPGVFTSVGHGYATGDRVFVLGCGGMTSLNFRWFKVVVLTVDTYSLTDLAGVALSTNALAAYTGGGTTGRVYEIVSPYVTADLFDLHYTQSNDVLTIVGTTYQQRELRRLGAANWQFSALAFAPTIVAPATATVAALPVSGATVNRYKVTAVATDGLEESYAVTVTSGASVAITGVTQANPGVITAVAHGRAVGDPVLIEAVGGMTQLTGEYIVNTVPTANTLTLKSTSGVVLDTTAFTAYTAGGTVKYAAIVNALTTAGNLNTITTALVTTGVRYNVYKYLSGLWGYIGQTSENTFVDNNITPDTTKTPPIPDDPYTSATNYPGAVGYYQQRRWFAGTTLKPQNVTASKPGTESNMSYSIPARDSDRIAFKIAARQANTVRHIVPLEDLVLLTAAGVWVLQSTTGVLTGATLDPRPKGRIGASMMQPVITDHSVLYGYDRGNRVREFAYRGDVNGGYSGVDVSITAPHLFDKYRNTQCVFTQAPHPTAWFVRNDGTLLGLTYVPEQEVKAWHTHTTQGTFESVCAVPEASEDVLYVITKRTLNGRTVRSVERLHSRLFTTLADAFFLDCAVMYNGAPATIITGLDHLNGMTVNALADGAVVRGLVVGPVTGGIGITLDNAASKVVTGLQITAKLKTLPLAYETQASGQGMQKNVNKVHLRIYESSGVMAGPSYTKLTALKQRTSEPYGSPPALVSDEKGIVVTPGWNPNGQICVQQVDPLPLTLLSMVLEVVSGG